MKSVIVVVTVLLGSLSMVAQNGYQSQMPLTVLQGLPISSPCPVGMHVRQGMGGQMWAVQDGQRSKVFASRLRLNLAATQSANADPKQITGATITVHGLNGKGGVVLIGAGKDRSAEVTKTMDVWFAPDDDKSVWTDLVLPGITSATMVVLDSVTYADGSTWKLAGHEGCHAVPDPMMPIARP